MSCPKCSGIGWYYEWEGVSDGGGAYSSVGMVAVKCTCDAAQQAAAKEEMMKMYKVTLALILCRLGYIVIVATDEKEALRLAESGIYEGTIRADNPNILWNDPELDANEDFEAVEANQI